MPKPKKTNVCIRWSASYLAYLKTLAHSLSLKRGEELTYLDLIREALEKQYPHEPLDSARPSKSA